MRRQKETSQKLKRAMSLALLKEKKPPKRKRMLPKPRNVQLSTSKRLSLSGNTLRMARDWTIRSKAFAVQRRNAVSLSKE